MNLNYYFNKDKYTAKYQENIPESKYKRIVFFSAGHESLYKTAINMFLDRPIIGQGPKMFRIKCNNTNYAEGVLHAYDAST